MALGKFDIEIGDQGVDVVIALYLQAEGRCEGQLLRLHRVDVHLLQPREERMQTLSASTGSGPSSASFPRETMDGRLPRVSWLFGGLPRPRPP